MSFNLVCKFFVCLFPDSRQLFLGRDVTVGAPHTIQGCFPTWHWDFSSQVSWTTHSTAVVELRSGCLREVWGWLVLTREKIQNITNSWTRFTVSLKHLLLWPAQSTQVLPSKLSIPLSVDKTLASLPMLQTSPELFLLNMFSDPLLPSPSSPATPFLYAAHTELISSGALGCSSK